MKKKNFLVFDLGASSMKSLLLSFNGKNVFFEKSDKFNNYPVTLNKTVYWNIFELFLNIKRVIKDSEKKFKRIESVGIDGWGADFCIFDKNNKMISNPVAYRDKDRVLYSDKLYELLSKEEIFKLTGYSSIPLIDLFQLYSLKILGAPEIREGNKYLSITDTLNYFLSGNMINEYTRATTSGLVNQEKKEWENNIIKIFDFSRNIFGEFIMPGTEIGKLSNNICEEIDIRSLKVIAPASHDTASAVSGIPISKKDKKWAFLSMGTWFCFGSETEGPIINNEVFRSDFSNEAATEGKNLLFKNLNGFWIIEKCKEKWEKEADKKIPWEEIIDLSNKSKPFNSFIDTDRDIFYDFQFNMPETIRIFCKESNQNIPNTIGEISRCVFESLSFKVAYNIKLIEEILGHRIETIYLMGGGTLNKIICQWVANAANITVKICPSETASIGNLLMQLKACKEIRYLSEGRKIISDSFKIKTYNPDNIEIWDEYYNKFYKKPLTIK